MADATYVACTLPPRRVVHEVAAILNIVQEENGDKGHN